MKLTKDEREELACILEWYLDDERDKERRLFLRGILNKLRG